MATYVNDLRLTELATGEGSGSWGTTTNVSLELIGEALGYATQQVFGSDADATTTIADGASDPARAMYFKITSAGSLTATRTCTIAPNTVSRVMFIENATTGSQSIAISQGSGANVTILTGKTAVVYLDGAGSGAAVFDAMAGVDPGVTDTLAEVLTAGNTTTTDQKIQFRDAAIYINSSADGQLDIVADTEIQIAATTIDINGAIVASGEISAASLDISGNVDIDGVLNVDAIDIDGAVQLDATLTVGVDDTGYDVKFYGATGGAYMLWDQSADDLILAGAAGLSVAGASTLTGVVTANAGVVVDNITIDGNEIDVGSGDLTLDVAGDIILDADGGDIQLKDAGVDTGRLGLENGDLNIASMRQDYDIKFKGMDGNTTPFTALTLDMSAAGAATFNAGVTTTDINLGTSTGQKLLMYANSNIKYGMSIETSEYRMFAEDQAVLTFGHMARSNGTTYTERMRIDSNGTLGIKTTPKTWTIDGLQLGTNAALSEDANSIYLSANAYMNSGWKRTNNQLAGYLRMGTNDGIMSFSNAVTGSADSAISWVERFRVHGNGNVGIGTTNPLQPLHVKGTRPLRLERAGVASYEISIDNVVSGDSSDFVIEPLDPSSGFQVRARNASNALIEALNVNKDGIVTMPLQPAFRVDQTYAAGRGTGNYNVAFSEPSGTSFDIGNNFSGNVFTAPVSGSYHFSTSCRTDSMSGYFRIIIGKNGSTDSNTNLHSIYGQPSSTYENLQVSGILYLALGDTARVYIYSDSDTSWISQGEGHFSGHLIG